MIIKSVLVILVAIIYLKITKDDTFNPDKDVKGKNVLVTGASKGIGELVAYKYAEMGANVFITARNKAQLKQVISRCRQKGRTDGRYGYAVADMEMYDLAAKEVIEEAVHFLGGLDHVILNHAYIPEFLRYEGTPQDLKLFEKTLDIDLMSYVHLSSHAIPYLRKSEFGRIGVISSMSGKLDAAYHEEYAASKFGLDGFFSSLRQEFRIHKENISVTLCNLGPINTDKLNSLIMNLEERFQLDHEKLTAVMDQQKGDPEEVAIEIIKATSSGDRELYYPKIMGTEFLVRLLPVVRHVWPSLLETDIDQLK